MYTNCLEGSEYIVYRLLIFGLFFACFANRVRAIIAASRTNVEEKKMFGVVCFMRNSKMRIGLMQEQLMMRLHPQVYDEALEKHGCIPMDITGRIMLGFVYIDENVLLTNQHLLYWVKLGLDFNQRAVSSKGKKKTGKLR